MGRLCCPKCCEGYHEELDHCPKCGPLKPDCAAYEARIANLEADKNHLRLERNAERATCRRLLAELARVKAESLRVVAHGAKMQLDELWCDEYLIACKGRVYIREYDTDNFVELSDGPCLDVHEDTIVQPVRLERWEEQG